MAAANQTGKWKVMDHFAMFVAVASIEDILTALPDRCARQRLVDSAIGCAAVIKRAGVDAIAKNLMHGSCGNLVAALAKTEPFFPSFAGDGFERVVSRSEPGEQ